MRLRRAGVSGGVSLGDVGQDGCVELHVLRSGAVVVPAFVHEEAWTATKHVDVKSIVSKVATSLRCVPANKIDMQALTNNIKSKGCGTSNLYALSQPAQIGEVDFFISHAW